MSTRDAQLCRCGHVRSHHLDIDRCLVKGCVCDVFQRKSAISGTTEPRQQHKVKKSGGGSKRFSD